MNFIIFVSGEAEINKHSTSSVLCAITIAQQVLAKSRLKVQIPGRIYTLNVMQMTFFPPWNYKQTILFLCVCFYLVKQDIQCYKRMGLDFIHQNWFDGLKWEFHSRMELWMWVCSGMWRTTSLLNHSLLRTETWRRGGQVLSPEHLCLSQLNCCFKSIIICFHCSSYN